MKNLETKYDKFNKLNENDKKIDFSKVDKAYKYEVISVWESLIGGDRPEFEQVKKDIKKLMKDENLSYSELVEEKEYLINP